MEENTIVNLKFYQGLIQFLADLLSFPGSEYLNANKLESDIENIALSYNNNELIKQLIALKDEYNNSDKQKLMVEYARLFVGPYHVIAPPYGSYYIEEGKLMGNSTIEVSRLYDNAGLAIKDSFKDLPDHIVAELEFLLYLIHNEILFLENSESQNFELINNLKHEFFHRYFYSWIKKFTEIIINNSELEFYRKVAIYLNTIVDAMKTDMNKIQNLN